MKDWERRVKKGKANIWVIKTDKETYVGKKVDDEYFVNGKLLDKSKIKLAVKI